MHRLISRARTPNQIRTSVGLKASKRLEGGYPFFSDGKIAPKRGSNEFGV
jgi:hypothetical protein